jgi:hypothetical protein
MPRLLLAPRYPTSPVKPSRSAYLPDHTPRRPWPAVGA